MRIAVVDDEDSGVQMLQEFLHRYAAEYGQVIDVQCFQDGLSFVGSFKNQFDVILLDVSMPGIDGMETSMPSGATRWTRWTMCSSLSPISPFPSG